MALINDALHVGFAADVVFNKREASFAFPCIPSPVPYGFENRHVQGRSLEVACSPLVISAIADGFIVMDASPGKPSGIDRETL